MNLLKKFANDESGATAIEYGLIAALISVAIIVAVTALGGNLSSTFEYINDCLTDECPAEPTTPA
ncbi:Flp family type IVb pilin [Pelagibacterium montanilacus]|uniref:Flp family type IVb pilin n=1 Tax=Pelagibacterium montanilacus TaxID=2185280 RepID=UPI000F8CBB8F|nr:Flp family type IVb pilin [Pelagibacterium montanilacus]